MPESSPLCLTLGDPAGCGPSITMEAWRRLKTEEGVVFYVRAAPELFQAIPVAMIERPSDAPDTFQTALPVIPLSTPLGSVKPGYPSPDHARATLESIECGVADILKGHAKGLVTNPISKAILNKAGFRHPGHTEYLAALSSTDDCTPTPIMMLVGGGLRVALATVHSSLREAIGEITMHRLETVAQIVHGAMISDFGLEAPRLAFTGLNPHAGEGGMLGTEEMEIINPAAESLRTSGINITDARPADTVFSEALAGHFDAVIAMTHDQGLIPVKTLDLWGGVNTTLGLPIIRTSPDHGTAYEATKLGGARPDSLIAAIHLASDLANARTRHQYG
ncbi:MAG: 4-hydroxythreonine-4-phosphate dehydrogenase PdxA [Pseudomonadota bacterium]